MQRERGERERELELEFASSPASPIFFNARALKKIGEAGDEDKLE